MALRAPDLCLVARSGHDDFFSGEIILCHLASIRLTWQDCVVDFGVVPYCAESGTVPNNYCIVFYYGIAEATTHHFAAPHKLQISIQ